MGLKNGWLQILAARGRCVFSVISPILTLLASVIGRNFDTLFGNMSLKMDSEWASKLIRYQYWPKDVRTQLVDMPESSALRKFSLPQHHWPA
jgi:hypothetical protein